MKDILHLFLFRLVTIIQVINFYSKKLDVENKLFKANLIS